MKNEMPSEQNISRSALIERINRKLADNSQDLKESRMTESPSLGHFYENQVSGEDEQGGIDLESLGRELGVLEPRDDDE